MLESLSLQLALAQQLSRVIQTIPAQDCLTPAAVPYRLRWGRNPVGISYICDFDPDLPLHHRRSLASMTLAAWDNRWDVSPVSWPQVLGSHCRPQILPSGQILFTPAALALGAWLWQLATTNKDLHSFPHLGLKVSPGSPDPTLAQRLQLSLRAVVHYTHGRCRQVLAITAARDQRGNWGNSTVPLSLGDGARAMGLCHRLYPAAGGESVLWGLVKLVDCLTLAPLAQGDSPEPHRFNAAYGLSVAIDGWLGHGEVDNSGVSTILLLKGIDRALGAVLSLGLEAKTHPWIGCRCSQV